MTFILGLSLYLSVVAALMILVRYERERRKKKKFPKVPVDFQRYDHIRHIIGNKIRGMAILGDLDDLSHNSTDYHYEVTKLPYKPDSEVKSGVTVEFGSHTSKLLFNTISVSFDPYNSNPKYKRTVDRVERAHKLFQYCLNKQIEIAKKNGFHHGGS